MVVGKKESNTNASDICNYHDHDKDYGKCIDPSANDNDKDDAKWKYKQSLSIREHEQQRERATMRKPQKNNNTDEK